jgi:hypothetical protein
MQMRGRVEAEAIEDVVEEVVEPTRYYGSDGRSKDQLFRSGRTVCLYYSSV